MLLGYTEVLAIDDDDITFYTHPTKPPVWWDGVTLHRGLKNYGPPNEALEKLT